MVRAGEHKTFKLIICGTLTGLTTNRSKLEKRTFLSFEVNLLGLEILVFGWFFFGHFLNELTEFKKEGKKAFNCMEKNENALTFLPLLSRLLLIYLLHLCTLDI